MSPLSPRLVPFVSPTPTLGDGLTLSVSTVPGSGAEIRAVGEIDVRTAGRFARALTCTARSLTTGTARTSAGRARDMVCDLTHVAFFGAAGVGALLDGAAAARACGVALTVVPSPCVHRVLSVTGTDVELVLAEPLHRR